jgi:hypothetical protein
MCEANHTNTRAAPVDAGADPRVIAAGVSEAACSRPSCNVASAGICRCGSSWTCTGSHVGTGPHWRTPDPRWPPDGARPPRSRPPQYRPPASSPPGVGCCRSPLPLLPRRTGNASSPIAPFYRNDQPGKQRRMDPERSGPSKPGESEKLTRPHRMLPVRPVRVSLDTE